MALMMARGRFNAEPQAPGSKCCRAAEQGRAGAPELFYAIAVGLRREFALAGAIGREGDARDVLV
jgi:hypothetical protein